jgi:predicted ferric reductase
MRVRSPALKLGEQAVNANVSFNMMAVLFWSHLIVMVLAALARTRFPPLKYASWLLLSVGLTQVSIVAALIVVGWFFALAWRETSLDDAGWFKFNGVQLLQPQRHLEEAATA